MLFPVAVEQVNERNLNHCIATRLLAHCGTRAAHKHLGCERGIVYSHIELEQLVLCCTRDALACEVDTVPHIKQVIDTRHLFNVCLVIDKVWVGLDGCCHLIEIISFFNLNINHTAVYACTHRDCH